MECDLITLAAAAMKAAFESLPVNFNAVKKAEICDEVLDCGLTMCSKAKVMDSSLKLVGSEVKDFNKFLKLSGVKVWS